jgi:hypothetical protein
LPEIHHLVTIRDSNGRESLSRVEDVQDGVLVLARPLDLLVEHEFGIGETVLVSWPADSGVTTATTELLESRLHGRLGLWIVQVIGPLRVEQRRRFVRVPAAGAIQLTITDDGKDGEPAERVENPQITGQLCSVSEGALRCVIAHAEAAPLAARVTLEARFEFGKQDFCLPALVLRAEPSHRDRNLIEVILLLQIDEDGAATLRRTVFAEQLRIRNGALGR